MRCTVLESAARSLVFVYVVPTWLYVQREQTRQEHRQILTKGTVRPEALQIPPTQFVPTLCSMDRICVRTANTQTDP
jgi:hypothetical protein